MLTADELVNRILGNHPEWVADPYSFYTPLRAQAPVHWSEDHASWVISTHSDVIKVLRIRAVSHGNYSAERDPRVANSPALQRFASFILFLDPPEHTRIRDVTRLAFTRVGLEGQRRYIEAMVDGLLGGLAGAGSFDLMSEFADPVSVSAICHVLGIPREDRDIFARWNLQLLATVFPGVSDEELASADESTRQLEDYLRGLMATRRKQPADDVISLLAAARGADKSLTEDEALGLLILLFIAGTDTTANLLASGTLALQEYPAEKAKLRANPPLISNAIDEFLRYDAVVHVAFPRYAPSDMPRLANNTVDISENDRLLLLFASANRDPAKFERPDTLNVERPNAREHVAFGHGLHMCLGANLARLSSSVAFSKLLSRWAAIEVAEEPVPWFHEGNMRRVRELTVSVKAA